MHRSPLLASGGVDWGRDGHGRGVTTNARHRVALVHDGRVGPRTAGAEAGRDADAGVRELSVADRGRAVRRDLPRDRPAPVLGSLKACAFGGVFFAGDIVLTFTAFRLTSVANATIIGALAPVFITLGAVRWFGERLDRRDAFVIASSFVGVAFVAIGSAGSPSWSPVGDAAAALSVLTWTAYWLFSKRARATVDAVDYMANVMLVSAIVVTLTSLVTGTSLRPPDASDWAWIVLTAIVPGLMGHLSSPGRTGTSRRGWARCCCSPSRWSDPWRHGCCSTNASPCSPPSGGARRVGDRVHRGACGATQARLSRTRDAAAGG